MTASAKASQIGLTRHGSDRFAAVRSQAAMSQMGRVMTDDPPSSPHRRSP
jgi:hypothetical protein